MNVPLTDVQAVSQAVLRKAKYRSIQPQLVERLAQRELAQGAKTKTAVKAVCSKLHQVGAAYFHLTPHYARWLAQLPPLSRDARHEEARAFCRNVMMSHSSSAERLPILADFYRELLAGLAPLESVCDLACGLNPLALAELPLAPAAHYFGCDIFGDLIDFNNQVLDHFGLRARLSHADVFSYSCPQPVQVALLLKSLPCLEQLEKERACELLESIPAPVIIVSYPIHSLGGKSKGMRRTYAAQFTRLLQGKPWQSTRFDFATELAFRLEK